MKHVVKLGLAVIAYIGLLIIDDFIGTKDPWDKLMEWSRN